MSWDGAWWFLPLALATIDSTPAGRGHSSGDPGKTCSRLACSLDKAQCPGLSNTLFSLFVVPTDTAELEDTRRLSTRSLTSEVRRSAFFSSGFSFSCKRRLKQQSTLPMASQSERRKLLAMLDRVPYNRLKTRRTPHTASPRKPLDREKGRAHLENIGSHSVPVHRVEAVNASCPLRRTWSDHRCMLNELQCTIESKWEPPGYSCSFTFWSGERGY